MKNKLTRIRKSREYSRLLQKHKKMQNVPMEADNTDFPNTDSSNNDFPILQQDSDFNSTINLNDPVELHILDEPTNQTSRGILPINSNIKVKVIKS